MKYMNLKYALKLLISTVILGLLMSCVVGLNIADLKSVSPLYLGEQEDEQGNAILSLKGVVQDSTLCVELIDCRQEGQTLNVLVYTRINGRTKTGNFDYLLVIPADIMQVTFGETKELLWSKNGGIEKSPYIMPEEK